MTNAELARLMSKRDEILTELIAALLARIEAVEERLEAMEAREGARELVAI